MYAKSLILAAAAAFVLLSLSSCNPFASDDGTENGGTTGDVTGNVSYVVSELYGTWVQVAGNISLADRDTFTFSANGIKGNTPRFKVSTLVKCASNGQIWEKFGSEKLYRYAYKIEGDTLWMLEENDTKLSFNKTWSIGFVKTGTDAGCGPTARADATFRSQFPDRYTLGQLRALRLIQTVRMPALRAPNTSACGSSPI